MQGKSDNYTQVESRAEAHKIPQPEGLEVNMDATLLFRYKLAEVQKQMQNHGIISDF